MRRDFYKVVRTSICKVKHVERESAVRLYRTRSNDTWNLQVRGPVRRANGSEGADFIVATASCSADDLRALREAIDRLLDDA